MTNFLQQLPLARELGMQFVSAGDGVASLAIPYDTRLIGDPETGVIHGGVVTTLLDTCGGMAVLSLDSKPTSTATLDLRIDYMRPAKPGQTLLAKATCYRETRSVVFLRAVAYHDDLDKPVATAVGAFMVEREAKTCA
ncbi:MAG: PaaI family thioesterase [Neomegalonema sp.]|nr:PaaI family thioesterase [Neomegalonema sp.]